MSDVPARFLLAALMLLAMCASGCAASTRPNSSRQDFEQTLQLSLTLPEAVDVERSVESGFSLVNRGARAIEACLSVGRAVLITSDELRTIDGRSPASGSASAVDHPPCVRRFRLAPGASFDWKEAVEIPRVSPGPASIRVMIQLVDPRRCSKTVGCEGTMLQAVARTTIR